MKNSKIAIPIVIGIIIVIGGIIATSNQEDNKMEANRELTPDNETSKFGE